MFILTPKDTWLRTQKNPTIPIFGHGAWQRAVGQRVRPDFSLSAPRCGTLIPEGARLILKITLISNHVRPTCSWKWTLSILQLSMVTSKYLEESGSRHFQLRSSSLAHTRSAVSLIMSSRLEKYKPIKISNRLHQTDLAIIWKWGCFFFHFLCKHHTWIIFAFPIPSLSHTAAKYLLQWEATRCQFICNLWHRTVQKGKKQCQVFIFCRHRSRFFFFFASARCQ